MYIHYSIGNNSGLWTLVRIVEVSVIGGVCFRRFHCIRNRVSYRGGGALGTAGFLEILKIRMSSLP